MPDFPEKGRDCRPKEPLPQGKSRQRCQIEPNAQVRPADRKGGVEPAGRQLQTEQELSKAQGLHRVGAGAEEHPRKKAAHEPLKRNGRGQRNRPRLRFGSS